MTRKGRRLVLIAAALAIVGVAVGLAAFALRDNIVTPEVKANGWGGIDSVRFAKAIEQIGLTYKWKATPPKPDDIFDASFLPNAADRKFN